MAKYTNNELVSFILASNNIDSDAKSQLINFLRTNRSYGMVWEDNPEEAVNRMRREIPVLSECPEFQIKSEDANAPEHIIIEGDNVHALSALCYSHEGKFDLIYVDPPYNTGARDWKYNNDYVDDNDSYRHSKWLSLMNNRLKIAKRLLNHEDSVLIVTIDDHEVLHLGCLLEQLFPGGKITMVSSVINPAGKAKKGGVDFSRTDEYIFFVQIGKSVVLPETREIEKTPIAWETFRRHSLANGRGQHGVGACGPNQFYPFYVDNATKKIVDIGVPIHEGVDRFSVPNREGCSTVFPVRDDGTEMNWGGVREEARNRLKKGYLRVGKYSPDKPQQYSIQYLTSGTIKSIENGEVIIEGYEEDGSVKGYFPVGKPKVPTTNWNKPTHNATSYGTDILTSIIGAQKFDYPKSLYAVKDCMKLFIDNKPNALILDFFAGSGTTMHATMLMNQDDGGHRRCFLVTNNENNICEEVTYLRNKRVIEGYDTPNGKHVDGLTSNSLRYFKVLFSSREQTHQSKRELIYSMTDLLRLKENCFEECSHFGNLSLAGKEKLVRFFNDNDKQMLIIYDARAIRYIVDALKLSPANNSVVKVYIFADGAYPYTEDFREILDRVELIPLPYTLNKALKYVLPFEYDIILDPAELSEEETEREISEAIEYDHNN